MVVKTKPNYLPTTSELKEACAKLLTVYQKSEDFISPIRNTRLITDVINALCGIFNHRWIEWQYDGNEGLHHIYITNVLFDNTNIYLEGFQVCPTWKPNDTILKFVKIRLGQMFTFANVVAKSDEWFSFYNCPTYCIKKDAAKYMECSNLEESEQLIDEFALTMANHLLALQQSK